MVPGTELGVLIGDLAYTWLALRLMRRTARCSGPTARIAGAYGVAAALGWLAVGRRAR